MYFYCKQTTFGHILAGSKVADDIWFSQHHDSAHAVTTQTNAVDIYQFYLKHLHMFQQTTFFVVYSVCVASIPDRVLTY